MEVLLGFGIVIAVLAVVLATPSEVPPGNLTDAGLEAQIEAVRGWVQRFDLQNRPGARLQRQHRRKQDYLAALINERQSRRTRQLPPR